MEPGAGGAVNPSRYHSTASGAGVMLAPGNMGAVTVARTNGFPPPSLQVQSSPQRPPAPRYRLHQRHHVEQLNVVRRRRRSSTPVNPGRCQRR